jgi:hypothetical protein
VIACHEVSTRTFATTPDRQCEAYSPVARVLCPTRALALLDQAFFDKANQPLARHAHA